MLNALFASLPLSSCSAVSAVIRQHRLSIRTCAIVLPAEGIWKLNPRQQSCCTVRRASTSAIDCLISSSLPTLAPFLFVDQVPKLPWGALGMGPRSYFSLLQTESAQAESIASTTPIFSLLLLSLNSSQPPGLDSHPTLLRSIR